MTRDNPFSKDSPFFRVDKEILNRNDFEVNIHFEDGTLVILQAGERRLFRNNLGIIFATRTSTGLALGAGEGLLVSTGRAIGQGVTTPEQGREAALLPDRRRPIWERRPRGKR